MKLAGIYNLEISDSLNCTSFIANYRALDSLEISTDVIDIACYGASTDLLKHSHLVVHRHIVIIGVAVM